MGDGKDGNAESGWRILAKRQGESDSNKGGNAGDSTPQKR